MDRITIDFERTMKQAAQLDEYADSLRKMTANEYKNTMHTLSSHWVSESASAFFAKGEILRENIDDTARDIESVAASLRRAARRIYEAERRAEEIAKQRNASR